MTEALEKNLTCNKCGVTHIVTGRHASVTRATGWSSLYGGDIQDTDLCRTCTDVLKEWLKPNA